MTKTSWAAVLLFGLTSTGHASGPADEAAVIEIQDRQAAAWNKHDAIEYGALFTPDADVVNVLGWHWRSRAELEEKLGAAFRSVFSQSRMTIAGVSVEFPVPEVAVAHVRWIMVGARSPTGSGSDTPEQGIQTQVLVRTVDGWRISHFQNTNSVPEQPFPVTP